MTLRLFSFVCLLTAVLVSMPTGQGRAQSPPSQDPILRVDPGMHTARIARIGVNPTCSFVASASDDKTVRLWRLPDGEPLKTLRPPIGPGYDGRVNAIAVAPDLTWVAAGVDALDTALKGDVVYVFQPLSGTILARLGPLQGSVTHLAVSPDGRYLAATLGGGHGLRIWQIVGANASSWRLIADDNSYGGKASYGAAFDRAGVLFTVADDGKLRRYAPGYDSVPKWALPQGGRVPRSVAAHPAGDRVAIGYEDTPSVDVYDSVSLGFRFAADTKFAVNGNLLAVAWSGDGNRLYAGGTFARVVGGVDKGSPIFVWDRAGQGAPQELPGPPNTVQHLLTCSDDIAVGASGPTLGLLAPDGSRRLWKESAQADLRGRRGQDVSVTQNGLRVRFGLNREHDPVLFDIAAEQLTDAPNRASDLVDADTTGLPVTDWFDSWQPKLSGIPIKLMQNEQSHALAVAPDAQRFVLGGDWSLRGFSKDGKQIWQKAVPTVWNLNVTRDGKLVVSAYGDGTVRWHRLSDGEELLALFVHKTDRRWVAWTPKGYYMASPGAESLIGWHVNRGWNEAPQFYSVDRFRDQFNRPDIVKSVLAALDESKAIDDANRRANLKRPEENVRAIAPPVILIQKPSDNASFRSPEVTLEYQAFSPTGQRITDVDVRINNSSLGSRAAVPLNARSGDSIKLTLTLPPEDVTITLVAREGTKASQPASVRLRWDGAKPGQVQLPRLRALFVGVNAYYRA